MSHTRTAIGTLALARLFLKIGASAFGGWSTTALLIEQELTTKRQLLEPRHVAGAVAYAQFLPGVTQVAIVANVGYRLRGLPGAAIATVAYLIPATSLIIAFAMLYFRYAQGNDQLTVWLDGLIAALSGVILANAYRIGSKHVTATWLWLLPVGAFLALVGLGLRALWIIAGFGIAGLLLSFVWTRKKR